MDVILNPIGSSGTEWSLDDRLGRHLGTIHLSAGAAPFEIEPSPTSALVGINRAHRSLSEAMSAISIRMSGTCELNSHDWD
ncbi:hypothetical protein [Methylobacterium nigriterrae]|uniref:hypothetical protein n=1 Tax=Methylobacterium nigriterrae TaxID=3127512 RepID=UPI003013C294